MLPVRIMTREFNLLNEIDQYSSLQITRSWNGIGEMELHINRYIRGAKDLIKGRIIFPHNQLNKAYVIRHREIELDENGKATENWIIKALPLKSWLGQRLTYPPSHTANDNKSSNAESVMIHYVNNNIINPVDVDRKLQELVLSENLNRGPSVGWQSRYKNLADELEKIGLVSGLGWNVIPDTSLKEYAFKVFEGRDLTVSQSILPPAIFSPEFNTLGELSYVESELNYRNLAIVAGQGEGVDRRILNVGDAAGYERYELFVDARDVEEEIEGDEGQDPTPRPIEDIERDLTNRGNQALSEREQEIYMEGQVLTKSRLLYEKDYDLGDLVTLQNKKWGITLDSRITGVVEVYEPGGKRIELVFGNNRPTLIDRIKQETAGMNQEMTR